MNTLPSPSSIEQTVETFDPDAVLPCFAFAGPVLGWGRHGDGHINDSLRVRCAGGDYLVQRLNRRVFPDGAAVMGNLARALAHLAAHEPDPARRLTLVPTHDGGSCLRDADGWWWRAFPFIAGTHTVERVADPEQAHTAALAFARFLARLADLPGGPLATVIPGFHDTPARLDHLADAARRDPCGRLAEVREEVAWALDQRALAGALLAARDDGRLPEVAAHNDAKIGNLLLHADDSGARGGACVVDLDTLMPGLALYDYGDLVRTAACRAAEDAPPEEMRPDPALLAALADGWLSGRGAAASPAERALMPLAGAVLTFECGVRFLADHLRGDAYFRIHRPGHNRERARAQLALARNLLALAN